MRLIDAEYVANMFCENCNQEGCEGCYTNNKMQCETRKMLEGVIDDSPTVEARSGRWYEIEKIYFCSICNARALFKTNFCPYCGADMRRDTDE